MFPFRKKKVAGISRAESLEGIPELRFGVSLEVNPAGERVLLIQRRIAHSSKLLCSLFGDRLQPRQIVLDDLGSEVVKKINGKQTVKSIISEFADKHDLHLREAEACIVEYLNMLMARNAISVTFKNDPFKKTEKSQEKT